MEPVLIAFELPAAAPIIDRKPPARYANLQGGPAMTTLTIPECTTYMHIADSHC
jgi:hypothetical protein